MKKLARIHKSSEKHWVGNGFPVSSVFEYNGLARELSPFLLLDYAAPYEFPPGKERRGVGAHPHRGFETVTIVFHGEVAHRDSSGGGGTIGPGDVQWMTAGSGIVHEEFHSEDYTRTGGKFHMVQLWVNLRAKDKTAKPGYQGVLNSQIPNVALPNDAGSVRIIAGDYRGTKGAAKTFSPINLWDVTLRAGKAADLPLPDGHTTTFLVLSGKVTANGGEPAGEADLAIFERKGDGISVQATTDARLLVMDGEPFAEPVVGYGPFVMNTQAEIVQAFDDYQHGRMGTM